MFEYVLLQVHIKKGQYACQLSHGVFIVLYAAGPIHVISQQLETPTLLSLMWKDM